MHIVFSSVLSHSSPFLSFRRNTIFKVYSDPCDHPDSDVSVEDMASASLHARFLVALIVCSPSCPVGLATRTRKCMRHSYPTLSTCLRVVRPYRQTSLLPLRVIWTKHRRIPRARLHKTQELCPRTHLNLTRSRVPQVSVVRGAGEIMINKS